MIINKDAIFLEVDLLEKRQVLSFISDKAVEIGIATNGKQVLQDLLLRESEYTTALQPGIAIPHAKSGAVSEPRLLFVKLKQAIFWESDEFNVQVVFAILVPLENTGKEYLQILSEVATNLLEEEFQEQLFSAGDEKTVLDVICNYRKIND